MDMITEQIKEKYLEDHIPYRLREVDGLRWACEWIAHTRERPCTSVNVLADGKPFLNADSFRFMTNPMVEIGILYCRVLLEFLGIVLNKSRELKARTSKPSGDITIEDFGLSPISVDDICKAPTGTPDEIRCACVGTILTAHKSVAHLTYGWEPNMQQLHRCSRTVPWLVCEYLYKPLGWSEPKYDFITAA